MSGQLLTDETIATLEDPVQRALAKLTPKERKMVLALTDPDSPTYGNKRHSVMAAYNTTTPYVADNMAIETLNRPRVQNALTAILEQEGAGYEVRARQLSNLALNRAPQTIETAQYDADGKLIGKQVTTKPVAPADQIKALRILSEQTGEDAVTRTQNRILSDTLMAMGKRMVRQAQLASAPRDASPRDATDVVDTSHQPDAADAATGTEQALTGTHAGSRDTGTGEGEIAEPPSIPSPSHISEAKKSAPPAGPKVVFRAGEGV